MADRDSAFARKIRGLRSEHDLSQDELAKAIGTSVATITNWENGETMPTLKTAIKLADLFGVSIDLLVGRAPVPI